MDPALWRLQEEGRAEDEVAVLARLRPGAEPEGMRVVSRFGDVVTCRVPRAALAEVHAAEFVESLKAARLVAREELPDRRQPRDLPDHPLPGDERRPVDLDVTGAGAVIGVVDWDCDFAHPDFRHRDGSSRLLALWDQRPARLGPEVEPYGYGTVHTTEDIDAALTAVDPYAALGYRPVRGTRSGDGHGSHVLGIAAGNGRSGVPSGVAPDAALVFVHLTSLRTQGLPTLGDSVTLLEAVDFVARTAGDRPWVVNVSVGAHGGPHDATTLVEQALDAAVTDGPGRMACLSVGNYARSRTHAFVAVHPGGSEVLRWEVGSDDPTPNELEVWYPGRDRLAVAARTPEGRELARLEPGERAELRLGGERVGELHHRACDPNNLDNHVDIFLDAGAPGGTWEIVLHGEDVVDGRCHAWIERDAICPGCQSRFCAGQASADSSSGTICNGLRTVVVGAQDAHVPAGPPAEFSSRGPTRDGRGRPDLYAPGIDVLSVRSRGGTPDSGPPWLRLSGTSMATPHVTGAVALLYEAAGRPLAAPEIRTALLSSTRAGPVPSGPGYLDLHRAVSAVRRAGVANSALAGRAAVRDGKEHAMSGWTDRVERPTDVTSRMDAVLDAADAAVRAGTIRNPAALLATVLPESAALPAPPAVLFDGFTRAALDGWDTTFEVVARPGVPAPALQAGDVLVRRALGEGELAILSVLATGEVVSADRLGAVGLRPETRRAGGFVHVLEAGARSHGLPDGFARRVTDAYGRVRRDTLVLRPHRRPDPPQLPGRTADAASVASVLPEAGISDATPPTPALTAPRTLLLVPKSGLTHARVPIMLRASGRFTGTGTLSRVSSTGGPTVRLFTASTGGTELGFDGKDNAFAAQRLRDGVKLFAEAAAASPARGDFRLTLALDAGTHPVGPPATLAITAVELTLDVRLTRTAPAMDPPAMSAVDKVALGRFVQVAAPGPSHERAAVVIRRPLPADVGADLVLHAPTSGTRVRAFRDEVPATGQLPLPPAHAVPAASIPAGGLVVFAEATGTSSKVRDTGFRLYLDGVDEAGDRVAMTAVAVEAAAEPTAAAPALTFVRFGLFDRAYDATCELLNQEAETDNFIGRDRRNFHLRVRDVAASGSVTVEWRTLRADARTDDDAPAVAGLTLLPATTGASVFVSRAVLLVTDDTDRDVPTHSGLHAPHDTGPRAAGTSNHRTRRAALDGFLRAEYRPAPGVRLPVVLPLFDRTNDERRRVPVRVIRYTGAPAPSRLATDAEIAGQFARANRRWNQVGIQIDPAATVDRPLPATAIDGTHMYGGSANNAHEQAAMADLIPVTPDDTLTVVFVSCSVANAYSATFERTPIPDPRGPAGAMLTLGERHFVFINPGLPLDGDTLGHELHHVLFNRGDDVAGGVDRQYFTFNTLPSMHYGLPLPDVRVRRRVHIKHNANPDNDPTFANVANWARRRRTARFPIAGDLDPAATASTGNRLTVPF